MASYTDAPINFSPYVSQLPIIEEMSKVSQEKQGRYNEGIQRIQSQIDNVAGLDIIRDVDKQYLQSKLDKLGNNLKTVAAGDFSNYQLVNSVGGMVGQIVKDSNIQNSIYSTKVVRKGQQDLELAKKEGKSSVQNERYWNRQVNSYMNDTDLNTKFTGGYVPYTDLTKKYDEVYKGLKESGYSYDMPFKTDEKGNPLYFTQDKNGNLVQTIKDKGHVVVDDAMKRISKKGIDGYTILENFYSNTTENDKRQLQIDAEYHYENATPDTFKNDIISNFALTKSQLEEKENILKLDINAGNITGEEKAKKQAELGRIQLAISELPNQQLRLLEDLQNPSKFNSFKIDLYTQKFLTELARDKASKDIKEEILSNPYKQSEMQNKRLDFDIRKENENIRQFNARLGFDKLKFYTEQAEKAQEKADKQGSTPVTHPGGNRTDIELPTAIKLSDDIKRIETQLDSDETLFLNKNKAFDKELLNRMVSDYRTSPEKANIQDPDIMEYVENRIAQEDEHIRKGKLQKAAIALTTDLDVKINSVLQNTKGLTDSSGREVYSAQELMDTKQRIEDYYNENKNKPGILDQISQAFIGTKYESVANAIIKRKKAENIPGLSNPDVALLDNERVITNKIAYLESKIGSEINPLQKEKIRIQSDFLKSKLPEYNTLQGTLDVKNNKHDEAMVDAIISDATNTDVKGEVKFDVALVAGWRENPQKKGNVDYKLRKNFDGSGELIVQHSTETPQVIPISKERFRDSFPRYAEKSIVDDINDKLIQSTEGTTNSGNKKDVVTASSGNALPLLKKAGIGHLVRWDVEGTPATSILDKDGKSTGQTTPPKYVIRLYVFDPKKKVWHDGILSNEYYHDAATLQEQLNGIGLNAVEYILKK